MNQEPAPDENRPRGNPASKKTSDHLANERTALAWIRTSLAIIGLGFVVSRFGLLLRAQPLADLPRTTIHYSSILGIAMAGLGTLTLISGLFSFLRIRRAIERDEFQATPYLLVALIGLLTLLSLFLFLYMWLVN
jgi:putative membrane protein